MNIDPNNKSFQIYNQEEILKYFVHFKYITIKDFEEKKKLNIFFVKPFCQVMELIKKSKESHILNKLTEK